MKFKLSIHRVFFFSIMTIASIALCIFGIWEIDHLYTDFKNEINILQNEHENEMKNLIRSEVQKVVFYIKKLQQHYSEMPNHEVAEAQREILETLVKQRFGKEGYFFGSTFQGEPLFSNGVITRGTSSVWDLTDPNGVKIIQEQIRKALEPDGGYVKYLWNKLEDEALFTKISYVTAVPEWQWVIGAGVYLDEIEEITAAKKMELQKEVKKSIRALLIMIMAFLLAFYLTAKLISKKIKANFDLFFNFFRNSDKLSARIDESKLDFPEFTTLAHATNFMMEQRELSEKALQTSEKKFRTLADSAPVLISIIDDAEGEKYLYANKHWQQVTGYSAAELENIKPIGLVHPEMNQMVLQKAKKQLGTMDNTERYELKIITKTGEIKILDFFSTPIIFGEKQALLIIAIDITDQKKSEEELKKHRHHLDELVKERTAELEEKNKKLEEYNRLFIGREFRIKELKERVKELEKT